MPHAARARNPCDEPDQRSSPYPGVEPEPAEASVPMPASRCNTLVKTLLRTKIGVDGVSSSGVFFGEVSLARQSHHVTPARLHMPAISLAAVARALVLLALLTAPAAAQRREAADSMRLGVAAPEISRDTVRRPRAIFYSDGYQRRLTVHRWGSYAMLPLFAAQYALGNRLLSQKEDVFEGERREPVSAGLRRTHAVTAGGVGLLFVANTVTGVLNYRESRRNPDGRGRRMIHALTLLAADAGFVATGVLGRRAVDYTPDDASRHRNVALGSMAVAAAGVGMMWILNRE